MTTKRNFYQLLGIVLILCLAISIVTAGQNSPAKSRNRLAADISVWPNDPTIGQTVFVKGEAWGGVPPYIFYNWTTSDGQTGSGKTTTFTFMTAGPITITLNVTDSLGNMTTALKNITVKAPPPLKADIDAWPKDPTIGQTVFVKGEAWGGVPPYIFYNWTTSDGQTGSGKTTTFTFLSAGPITITLNVTDSLGNMTTALKNITVKAPPPLKAEIDAWPKDPTIGQLVTFKAKVCGGVSPFTYAWNTSDGQIGTGQTVAFSFPTAGLIKVTLNVTDSLGNMTTAVKNITVKPPPPLKADIDARPDEPRVGQPVYLEADDVSGGVPPYAYAWNTSDGQTGAGKTVIFIFPVAGHVTVTLNVTDSLGTFVTDTKNIVIKPPRPLTADIDVRPDEPRVGQPVYFEADDVSGGVPPYAYAWNTSDGQTGAGKTVIFIFPVAGHVTVTLNVTDSLGTFVTDTKNIVVKPARIH